MLQFIPWLLLLTALATQNSKEIPAPIDQIQLTEFTRGVRRSIEVGPDRTIVRVNEEEETTPTTAKKWEVLQAAGQKVNLPELQNLEIVSKNYQTDAALHATITVVTKDSSYVSPTFDHNAPPAELKSLVDLLYQQVPASMRDKFQR